MNRTKISFVIPVKDEEQTIVLLYEGISKTLEQTRISEFEVIFVDDGSTDASWANISSLTHKYPATARGVRLRRNFGKAAALRAGFARANGEIIFTMDADLQDDPAEIPKFLAKIQEGYHVVSGWKLNRQDPLSKTLPSRLFNKVTSLISGIDLHDFNCGFKAYRSAVLKSIRLYGEMHRYIPVLAHDFGFRIGEVSVVHHPRRHGVSKYGWRRYMRGFIDLLTVVATTRYVQSPGHLFGGIGIASGSLGTLILSYLTALWFLSVDPIGNRPLFFLGILLVILSVQMISLGILAELLVHMSESRSLESLIMESSYNDGSSPDIAAYHCGQIKSEEPALGAANAS